MVMSYYLRFAIHNTPLAQQYVLQLMQENKRLREIIGNDENLPPPSKRPCPQQSTINEKKDVT